MKTDIQELVKREMKQIKDDPVLKKLIKE